MPSERWERLELLFAEVIARPAGQRQDFLADRCGPDTEMRDEVSALLVAAEQAGDFLSAPAIEVFARQIGQEGWSVRSGDRIGCYAIERRLGAGGMGEVWRARDERLGRNVAIKLLLPHSSDTDQRVQGFQREACAAGSLNHPNVLTVHDVGDHQGAPYLVTECLEGEPLRARLASGALSVDASLDVAIQVARGLGAAHGRGVVHRDLKPENIFLARDGRVKILDFGLATLRDSTSLAANPDKMTVDASRSLVAGTPGYMAPEQVCGEVVDGRADIFALGAVLYEMLAGRRPFKRNSTQATLDAVLTSQPPGLCEENPDVSPDLAAIVRQCLAKSPDDRFATVADVVSALESVARIRNLPPPPGVIALFRWLIVIAAVSLIILTLAAARWRLAPPIAHWARSETAPAVERVMKRDAAVTRSPGPAAYEAYLLGRFYLKRWGEPDGSFQQAGPYLERAIALDPRYAAAHAALAEYLGPRGLELGTRAKAAALRALELDDYLPEAHRALANVLLAYDWDWAGAERHYRRALALDPNDGQALQMWARIPLASGRFGEAIAARKRATELLPLSADAQIQLATAYYMARQYDEAMAHLRRILTVYPNLAPGHFFLGTLYVQRRMYPEALAEGAKCPGTMCSGRVTGYALAKMGRVDDALTAIDQMRNASTYVSRPVDVARVYTALGNYDDAFAWLERAFRERNRDLIFLRVDEQWDPLRTDPRFADLVGRVGIP